MNRAVAGAAVAGVAALAVAVAGAAHTRALGERAMAASDDALAHGDAITAVDEAKRAAEAASPGSPWPAHGYARLEDIGRDAASKGDDVTATRAWRAMRTAAVATGAEGSPERVEADRELAAAAAREAGRTATASPGAAARDAEQKTLADLSRDATPGTTSFALLAAAALALYAAAAAWLGRRRAWSAAASTDSDSAS